MMEVFSQNIKLVALSKNCRQKSTYRFFAAASAALSAAALASAFDIPGSALVIL